LAKGVDGSSREVAAEQPWMDYSTRLITCSHPCSATLVATDVRSAKRWPLAWLLCGASDAVHDGHSSWLPPVQSAPTHSSDVGLDRSLAPGPDPQSGLRGGWNVGMHHGHQSNIHHPPPPNSSRVRTSRRMGHRELLQLEAWSKASFPRPLCCSLDHVRAGIISQRFCTASS
jgi:hypothetical protein